MLCLSSNVSAQYFEEGGIAYNVLSATEHTVKVASLECTYYRGRINILSMVVHNQVTYDVVALGEEAFAKTTALIFSCDKEEVANPDLLQASNNAKTAPQNEDDLSVLKDGAKSSKISLAELKKLCQEDDDIAFFKENRMVDNTAIYANAQAGLIHPTYIDGHIHFEWHWPSLTPKPLVPPMPKGTTSIDCGEIFLGFVLSYVS